MMAALGHNLAKTELLPATAFQAHFQLTNIHPFADGNGRTARLLMNLILVRGGYQPVAIRMNDRNEYLDALEVASNDKNIIPFQAFMHRRLADTMSAYVGVLKETLANQEALEKGNKEKIAQVSEQKDPTAAQSACYQQTLVRGDINRSQSKSPTGTDILMPWKSHHPDQHSQSSTIINEDIRLDVRPYGERS